MKPEALAKLVPYFGPTQLWAGAEATSFYVTSASGAVRSRWARGPWDHEPDRVEWRHKGLPCLIVRQPNLGHLCGYVGVPEGHPLHGKGLGGADELSVHGGITYGSGCQDIICHVPAPGESDAQWWLGFDCAHFGDMSPYTSDDIERYCDVCFVRNEVEQLAEQIADYGK